MAYFIVIIWLWLLAANIFMPVNGDKKDNYFSLVFVFKNSETFLRMFQTSLQISLAIFMLKPKFTAGKVYRT